MPDSELEPSSVWSRPTVRVRRFALPIGTAIVVVAGFVVGRATIASAPLRPIVITVPTPPAEPTPEVEPAPAPAPAPPVQPVQPAQPCPSRSEEGKPPSEWTMSEEHFGPFDRCSTALDLAYLQRILPGFEIAEVAAPYFPEHHLFQVSRRGRLFLTIAPPWNDGGGPGLQITIHTRAIETPWRVRVGDRVGALTAHHRGIICIYGAAEGEENLWCRRDGLGDGWHDTLRYTIDMGPLGKDRSLVRDEIDPAKIAHLRIAAIDWQPASTAQ